MGKAAKLMDLCNDRIESSAQRRYGFCLSRQDDWRAFVQTRANILVTGPDAAVKAFVHAARPAFRDPVRSVVTGGTLELQKAETLILHDVDRLDRAAQQMLLEWLNEPEHGATQIVSTAAAPLFQLVQADQFDGNLYYRLNTVWLEAEVPSSAPPSP
jgi:DNA-binding NtrC family response regulator